jgi:hypothetical protein
MTERGNPEKPNALVMWSAHTVSQAQAEWVLQIPDGPSIQVFGVTPLKIKKRFK